MRITDISISQHRMPLDPAFNAAWDGRPRTQFDATIVRVGCDNGMAGIGSGDLMVGFAGHEELFIGRDPRDLERHWRVLDNIAFHYGRCWPLDCALWDLAAKIDGQPLYRRLGGSENRVRAYASTGTLRSPEETADVAERLLAHGFGAMKIRFHRPDWRDDVKAIEQVRARVGDRIEVMVDCNQGWRMPWDTEDPWDVEMALEVGRVLQSLGVYWMEEPLHRGDYAGMARLRQELEIRIGGAEMTRELHELETLIERGCLDVMQADAVLTGGIGGLAHIASKAKTAGVTFSPHTWTNGVGVLANAHLAAAFGPPPWLEFPYDPPEWTPARRDYMLKTPLEATDGWIVLPDAPGLGIELDEERLAETRIG